MLRSGPGPVHEPSLHEAGHQRRCLREASQFERGSVPAVFRGARTWRHAPQKPPGRNRAQVVADEATGDASRMRAKAGGPYPFSRAGANRPKSHGRAPGARPRQARAAPARENGEGGVEPSDAVCAASRDFHRAQSATLPSPRIDEGVSAPPVAGAHLARPTRRLRLTPRRRLGTVLPCSAAALPGRSQFRAPRQQARSRARARCAPARHPAARRAKTKVDSNHAEVIAPNSISSRARYGHFGTSPQFRGRVGICAWRPEAHRARLRPAGSDRPSLEIDE